MSLSPDLLRRVPLFDDLTEVELREILSGLARREVAAGGLIYREGESAGSAAYLVSGELEARQLLPGGGEAVLGWIRPGSLFGEMALLESGRRTASLRARQDALLLTLRADFFRGALDEMRPAAFKILRAALQTLTGRLDDLQARIFAQWDCDNYLPPPAARAAAERQRATPEAMAAAFLPALPCFADFTSDETDRLLAQGRVMSLPAETYLQRRGFPAQAAQLVLRGVLTLSVLRERRYDLARLGPGRLLGANGLIVGRPHGNDVQASDDALLLQFDAATFGRLFQGEEGHALKFQKLLAGDLLAQLKTANALLNELVSQGHRQQQNLAAAV